MLARVLVLSLALFLVPTGAVAVDQGVAAVAGHAAAKPKPKPKRRHPARRPAARPAAPAPVPATLVPDDPFWSSEWGLARIGMPTLWRVAASVPGAVVAVVDTGVDAARPDLAGAVLAGVGPPDAFGHGTSVAEVAAARGDDAAGAAGVCWTCRILPVDVAPQGTATAGDLAAGIRFAVDHGANVINLSLVLSGPDERVAAAVADAEARGALVVAAAGNGGGTAPTYPAAYPGVVGVVAVDASDAPYGWSTHGPWATLAAPGCSTVADAAGGAAAFCGSSAAAPVVSGLAGLVWSRFGSAAAVRAALAASAVPVDPSLASAGRVDAVRLAAILPK